MKRWLPTPFMSAALFGLWLLLNQSADPVDLLLAATIAVVMPLLVAPLRPPGGPMRRPLVLARLIFTVGGDVVVSALQVARGILRPGGPRSTFVVVPLELRNVQALASLAVITTAVPGTVWSELAPDRSALILHVFDTADAPAFVAWYKNRYERPLMEIFE